MVGGGLFVGVVMWYAFYIVSNPTLQPPKESSAPDIVNEQNRL